MGKSAKIRYRRRRRQARRWTPITAARLAQILDEIIDNDATDDTCLFSKWLTVRPYE